MFTFRSLVLPLTAIALTACADRAHEDPLGETGALTTGQANDGAAAGACLETLDRSSEPAAYLQCQHQLLEAFESRLARRMDKGSEGWEGTTSWVENETRFLTRLTLVFLARRAINDGPDWQATSEQFDQRLQSYRQNLLRNPHVIDGIRRDLERLTLTTPPEERRLIEQNWQQLQRSGVFLSAADADRLQSIDQTLGELQGLFRDNLDRATLRYETLITDPRRLDGLSIDQIAKARQDAEDRGHEEGWVLTLKRHRLYPALRQLRDREQRQALHQAHQFRAGGMRVGQVGDNPELMRRILSLRLERARLLGFDHALAFQLADSGLASIEMLYELLDAMERAAKPIAAREVDRLRLALQGDGFEVEPQAWDLLYYTHREEKRATADGQPEVAVSEMQALDALFASAQALWDLEFEPLTGIGGSGLPRFQVHDGQGKPLGAVTFDLGHRRGKRGGAWMSVLQHAETDGQQRSPAIVEIQSNFGPGEPGALSLDANAVETLFHEFGHVLMELFSATRHRSLAGNQLPPDAIEVPALIFERLAFEDQALASLNEDIGGRVRFGHGYDLPGLQTLREIALIRIDLAWHSITSTDRLDPDAIAAQVIADMELPEAIRPIRADDGDLSVFGGHRGGLRYRSLWANALAADVTRSLLADANRPAAAARLRQEVFSRGNTRDLEESVTVFLGRAVSHHALICELGLQGCEAIGASSVNALAP